MCKYCVWFVKWGREGLRLYLVLLQKNPPQQPVPLDATTTGARSGFPKKGPPRELLG